MRNSANTGIKRGGIDKRDAVIDLDEFHEGVAQGKISCTRGTEKNEQAA